MKRFWFGANMSKELMISLVSTNRFNPDRAVRLALADQIVLSYLPRSFLAAIKLCAQPPDLLGAQPLGVGVVEFPVRVLAPPQRRLHRGARPQGRFEQAQGELERERLRLRVVRPARAVA